MAEMEQEFVKSLKERLDEINTVSGRMDMETHHMFQSLRMLVASKIKI
jgi:hypothetical protein